MRRSTLLLPLVPVVLLAAACGGDDAEPAADPTSPPVTVSVDGRTYLSTGAEDFPIVDGSVIQLTFDDGNLGVSAGCNQMGGTYTIEDGVLQVGTMAMTEMACDEPLMDQDARVSAFLSSGPTVAVDGDELTLTADGATITFLDREVADPDRPVEGTEWTVTGVIQNDAVSGGWDGATATLLIEGGELQLNTGCNTGSGSVEVGEGTLTFGPIATTKMACEKPAMELEAAVLAVLDGETTYEIEAASMTIMNGDQGLQLTAAE